jgi:N-acetylglutamate synthase-like GNAT family acetyltransferase
MSRGIDFQVSGDCHKHDGITIRRAKQVDKGAIWQVHVRAIKEVCKTHYSERELKMWTEVLKPDRYEEQIGKGPFYVAVEDETIIGFGNLNKKSGEIEALYVDPEHLRQGVGIKILQALENEALDSGLKRLCLTSSLNAVGFYEMAGYRPQRQKRWLLPSEMVVCVTMTKELA